MSSMVFALLLFGCSDDGTDCKRLSQQPKYYDSQVLCEADIDTALESEIALRSDYPSVIARCMPSSQAAVLDRGGPVDLTAADPTRHFAMLEPRAR